MKMGRRIGGWALGLAAVWGCLPAGAQQARTFVQNGQQVRELQGEIPLAMPAAVRVQAQAGSVELRPQSGSGNTLGYSLRFEVAAGPEAVAYLDSWPVAIERRGEEISIATGAPSERGDRQSLQRGQLTLVLTVPVNVRRVEAYTAVGDVSAQRLAMPLELVTRAGNLHADALRAALVAVASSGNIVIGRAEEVTAHSAGSIRVERADGPVELTTTGGEVVLGAAAGMARIDSAGGGIEIGQAAGPVMAYSQGGNIRLTSARALAQLQTEGGNITVEDAQTLRCATRSGDIVLAHLRGQVDAQTGSGRIEAAFAPGARLAASELVSRRGAVEVRVPPSVGSDIQAQIVAPEGHRIQSAYAALAQPAGAQTMQAPGLVQWRGPVNGGGATLRLLATGGDIVIRNPE